MALAKNVIDSSGNQLQPKMATIATRRCFSALAKAKDTWISSHYRSFGCSSALSSRYSPAYLEPTIKREEVEKPLTEDDPRRYQPIKAAKNEQVYSLNYDELIQKFIRHIMREGKRDRAVKIVQNTFENIKLVQLERYHKAKTAEERANIELDPKVIFYQAVDNCKPLLITQKVKRGGVLYQVPIPVKDNYQTFTSMKWIIESASEKDRGIRIWDKLANELLDAFKNQGRSVRKKQELHRLCETNRAYAHFRW